MRVRFFVLLAALIWSGSAHALPDAGLDSGLLDSGLLDSGATDGGEVDASDAAVEAGAKDASSGSDASGACCPQLPCTCPSDDAGNPNGDAGITETSGGCSCESAPHGAGSTSPLLLLAVGTLLLVRSRKKK